MQLLYRSGHPRTHHHRLPGLQLALQFQYRPVVGGFQHFHLYPGGLALLLPGFGRGIITGHFELTRSHPDHQKNNNQKR